MFVLDGMIWRCPRAVKGLVRLTRTHFLMNLLTTIP